MEPKQTLKIKLIGLKEDTWPMIEDLWQYYAKKGIKTVFLNVGVSSAAYADLEIAETLGCPVHTWDPRDEVSQKWDEVKQILKSRKCPDSPSDFTEEAEKKWVLPKNIHVYPSIPGFTTGSLEVHSKQYPTTSLSSCVKQMINNMKVTEERIDILKVCLGEGMERGLLYALMDSPYRPGLILVDWSTMPDSDLNSTLCAGHLQNCGYSLLANKGTRFLYTFTGDCVYEICSWETNMVPNPMIYEIGISVTKSSKIEEDECPKSTTTNIVTSP
jgi:hypothetical protein